MEGNEMPSMNNLIAINSDEMTKEALHNKYHDERIVV